MAPSSEMTLPASRRSRKSISAHTDFSKAMEKENATVDVASSLDANRKKSRSKSIGPGGLDALKQSNGNRRASLAAPPKLPRSILKPTISSLPEIPPLKPQPSSNTRASSSASPEGDELSGSKIAVRTEEEQQAAAREREERDRRDARRKSLANRRVSFAAEATLHTFHEVEHMQDRRKSSSALNGRNSTSQGLEEDQNDTQQRKGRRSSVTGQGHFRNEDDTVNSTIYSSDSEPADAVEEIAADDDEEDEDSNSDSDDGTMMSIETEEVTGTSIASDRSIDMVDESSTLDEALRIAARRAGNQQTRDEDSDEGEEIIPAFGWAKKGNQQQSNKSAYRTEDQQEDGGTDMDMDMEMDVTQPMGKIIKPSYENKSHLEPEQEMSMDVTRAFGGILPAENRPHMRLDSAEMDDGAMDEATMELTTAIGGIHRKQPDDVEEEDENEDMSMELTAVMGGLRARQKDKNGGSRRQTLNGKTARGQEDATMDMTVGLGRIISAGNSKTNKTASENGDSDATMNMDSTMGMDMTVGLGGIISAASQKRKRDEVDHGDSTMNMDATMGMDMTMAMGSIIKSNTTSPRTLGKRILESEVDKPSNPKEAILEAVSMPPPSRRQSHQPDPAKTPESISFRERGSAEPRNNTTASPTKPSTPQPSSASPRRVLRSHSRTPQSASARKSHLPNPSRTPSPVKPKQGRDRRSIFRNNSTTEQTTPTAITPQRRSLTGVGADRNGLGSPQVAAIFESRGSIHDSATKFVPGKRTVAFEDPKELVEEVGREQLEQVDKENQSGAYGRESQEEKDVTLNLREMIASMSPKRNPLKGRKSLHVGSASGLLGKRPAELDDEDAEDNDGVKRLKGHQGSPVKNVKLQQPPSKEETTGKLMKPQLNFDQSGRAAAHTFSSPLKGGQSMTPRKQDRFNGMKDNQTVHEVQLHDSPTDEERRGEADADEDRIHLQDFLNMTSIRFMELTTTKRRHTVAPGVSQGGNSTDDQDDRSVERCVVAGACTVPMLELYQHSCRELKKYISEGRRIVKEIETETFEENPPLFQEYISATADVKALMDNQFKNVKTHARHLSKAMWYEWRMKLQDGLKEGLVSIVDGMNDDVKHLEEQEKLLASVMPDVSRHYEALLEESSNLEEAARELADCDPAELEAARDELTNIDEDIVRKKKLIAQLRGEFEASEADVAELSTRKSKCLLELEASERIREECRGWTSAEVNNLKAQVDAIEKEHGWAVTGISGSTLSLTYKREIELVVDINSFQPHQPNSVIDLWYIADSRESNPLPKTVEKDFFLQCVRDHVRALPQSRTKLSELLSMVRAAWDKARLVSHQIRCINISFPTKVTKTSDSSIAVTSSLLLVPLETRVEVTLNLHGYSGPEGVKVNVSTDAKVVYGEQFNVGKVGEFLATRIGKQVGGGEDQWSDVVVELHERLIARGQK